MTNQLPIVGKSALTILSSTIIVLPFMLLIQLSNGQSLLTVLPFVLFYTFRMTGIFSMIVLEKPLAHVYSNIDIVTTPTGLPVAMVHANNSASDINAWAKLFAEFAKKIGHDLSTKDLYQVLFDAALTDATPDAGGLSGYGYYSGENITGVPEGRPLLVRQPDAIFSVGNHMRLHIFSAFGAIKIGMRLLADEDVLTDNIVAQGGVFKTPVVAQKLLAAVLRTVWRKRYHQIR